MSGRLKKHSVALAGHRTSFSLEPEFWEALRGLAKSQARTINDLVSEIDRERSGNLSSAIRVRLLQHYRGLA